MTIKAKGLLAQYIRMIKPYNNYIIFSMNYSVPDILENVLTKRLQYTINVAKVLANKSFIWNRPESSPPRRGRSLMGFTKVSNRVKEVY
jgi:hypothetical protein